ncbi:hypothetical protein K435DRAFT_814430, partial [Dendrothele bispora CBS 962.96]
IQTQTKQDGLHGLTEIPLDVFFHALEKEHGVYELEACLNIAVLDDGTPRKKADNIVQDHPEHELSGEMVKRIEKRWKDCDQPVFLSALISNPYEKLSCFGPCAGLNQFKVANIIVWLYRGMNLRADNEDSAEERKAKEKEITYAVYLYLSTTGPFADFEFERQNFESTMGKDPIAVWNALAASSEVKELSFSAVKIFKIVSNSAGCERVFSDTKYQQSFRRNRPGLEKLQKLHKVGSDIRTENQYAGLAKICDKRKIHKEQDVVKLLS